MSETEEPGVAAVDRALSILAAFSLRDPALSLAELAARTGLYKSTILRLAQSLQRAGFLQRLDSGQYRVGPAGLRLATIYRATHVAGDLLLPVMRALLERTGESVAFYVPEGEQRVCLYRVNSDRPVAHQARVGDAFALPDGAAGRVLAAFIGWRGEPYDSIRRTGAWSTAGERDPDLSSIAAAVFGPERQLVGALTIGGPRRRIDPVAEELRELLVHAAAGCTRRLGGESAAPRHAVAT
jgi:DNA-binding IclR family transcriptional regulator